MFVRSNGRATDHAMLVDAYRLRLCQTGSSSKFVASFTIGHLVCSLAGNLSPSVQSFECSQDGNCSESGHLPMVDGVDEFARVLEFLRR
ncbi:hypothetical protein EW146_g109 [Bondarzewia mesenterica]|uniref:Uncharacterized protein n=1 Tax=Bondarzewia mesenterica TaxID=1095465 RepID=A0A4S4M800_9AGAM|nr:hypothetical protein EW146_g109 [Bondarzewia mesenterica]